MWPPGYMPLHQQHCKWDFSDLPTHICLGKTCELMKATGRKRWRKLLQLCQWSSGAICSSILSCTNKPIYYLFGWIKLYCKRLIKRGLSRSTLFQDYIKGKVAAKGWCLLQFPLKIKCALCTSYQINSTKTDFIIYRYVFLQGYKYLFYFSIPTCIIMICCRRQFKTAEDSVESSDYMEQK